MYIYTSEQIKETDQRAEDSGMPTFTLMENAGNGLYNKIAPLFKVTDKVLILAGRGNNGGDGIVLARYLKSNGFQAELTFPLGEPKTKTAQEHLSYYKACGFEVSPFRKDIHADWIVDSLLGVGSKLPLREDVAQVTTWINSQNGKIIAIDVPTGVSSDNGEVDAHGVCADYTFSLHGYKPSAFLFPSSTNYGKTEVVYIGVPQTSKWKIWNDNDVMKTWPNQMGNTHKGTFGTGLLIGGSDDMPGSVALAAIGAMRFGIGKLTVATTRHASAIIGRHVPEATFTYEWDPSDIGSMYSCVAIGPGLVPNEVLEKQVLEVLKKPLPVVLDAGALSARKYDNRVAPTVLTPHPGEFSRLIGKSTKEIQLNRMQLASHYAVENKVILILKGSYTVIAFPDGSGYINPTGNRALSKGGTGDTLTGMLLASICSHHHIKEAVANAVYLHGACADEWVKTRGGQTMLAHDFNQLLPRVCARYS